jgi:hypothetical protein
LGAKLFRIPDGGARRTFVFTTSLHNYAIFRSRFAMLFDRDTMGVLFAFYLGVELAFWSIALAQLTGHSEQGSWRRAINPPIVAIPTAILLNALAICRLRFRWCWGPPSWARLRFPFGSDLDCLG